MDTRARAYAVGYYGMSNFGDDLFGEVLRRRADDLLPGYSLSIVGAHVGRQPAARLFRWLNGHQRVWGAAWRLAVGVLATMRARLVVLGGGSVLWSMQGVRAVQWRLSSVTRTRFEALGVSVGPFARGEDQAAVGQFLTSMRRVIVRDRRSLDTAFALGVTHPMLGGDLAALFPPPPRISRPKTTRRVGVAPCNFDGATELHVRELADSVADSLRNTAQPGVVDEVVLLSLNGHPNLGDDDLIRSLGARLAEREIDVAFRRHGELGVEAMWATIASLDALVAIRLHAGVVGYLSEVPFVLVEYHRKCVDFADDIGLPAARRLAPGSRQHEITTAISGVLADATATGMPVVDYVKRAEQVYLGRRT